MKELYSALSKAQRSYKQVKKSGLNDFFKKDGVSSKYPTLNDYIEASFEALSDNGLCVIQELNTKEDGRLWLKTTLAHSSGELMSSEFLLIFAKQDMQSLGSATSYGRRYAYSAMVQLAPEDDDGNAATGKGQDDGGKKEPNPPKGSSVPQAQAYGSSKNEQGPPQTNSVNRPEVSEPQVKRFWAMTRQLKWSIEDSIAHLKEVAGVDGPAKLSREQYKLITDNLQHEIDNLDEIPF